MYVTNIQYSCALLSMLFMGVALGLVFSSFWEASHKN